MLVRDRSSFGFRRIVVFDAAATVRAAALMALAAVLALYWSGPRLGVPVLVCVIAGFYGLSRLDRSRPSCVSLRTWDVTVEDCVSADDFLFAEVHVGRSSVAKLGRRLGRFDHIYLPPMHRRLPIAGLRPGWRARWESVGIALDLTAGEVPGAARAVLKGSDIRVEILVGGLPDTPSGPLAVRLESSEGVLESWDPLLRPSASGPAPAVHLFTAPSAK